MHERIGKYHVIRAAGAGGFGTVYEGYDLELDRNVAIKICSSKEPNQLERFHREARIVSKLRHRNIALVYEYGFDEKAGVHYLIEEFLSGVDLEKKLVDGDRLPSSLRVRYLNEIAHGLQFVHGHGLIHRDLTPRNLRIQADHSVKIMDFGLAKDTADSTLTHVGDNFGTVGYTAPEQITGMRTVDHRTDIFSFGVIAYELLTFVNPFQAESMGEFLQKIHHCEPQPITELWPECPGEFADLVHRCIRKAPEDRFEQCAEMLPILKRMIRRLRDDDVPAPFLFKPSSASSGIKVAGGDVHLGSVDGWSTGVDGERKTVELGALPDFYAGERGVWPSPTTLPVSAIEVPEKAERRSVPAVALVLVALVAILVTVVIGVRQSFDEPSTTAAELAPAIGPEPAVEPEPAVQGEHPELRLGSAGTKEYPIVVVETLLPPIAELSHCYVLRQPAWSYGEKIRRDCAGELLRHNDRIELVAGTRYTYSVQMADDENELLAESSPVSIVAGE